MTKGTKMLISGITKKNIKPAKKIDKKTFNDIKALLESARESFNKNQNMRKN